MDAIKILGSLLGNGALSRGSGGGNILGSVLGAALGGGGRQGGGMADMLGGLLGGGAQQQQGGGLAGMLGGLMGGGQQQSNAGGLGGMLGGLLGGGGAQQQPQGGGGLAGMLGGLMGGAQQQGQAGGGVSDLLGSLMGGGGQQGQAGGLGDLLGASVGKFAEAQNPEASKITNNFLEGTDQGAMQEQAKLMIRTMINAAKADGKVDDEEQAKIMEKLGDISAEETEFVRQEFNAPFELNEFVRSVPAGMEQQIYLMSILAIDLDTQEEAKYLANLAQAMNISPEQCNQIHEQVGAPKLFG